MGFYIRWYNFTKVISNCFFLCKSNKVNWMRMGWNILLFFPREGSKNIRRKEMIKVMLVMTKAAWKTIREKKWSLFSQLLLTSITYRQTNVKREKKRISSCHHQVISVMKDFYGFYFLILFTPLFRSRLCFNKKVNVVHCMSFDCCCTWFIISTFCCLISPVMFVNRELMKHFT